MTLNNGHDRTIKDLKATYFDLFTEHVGELAKMIESIANDEAKDVVKMETAIFQRIILLNNTAGSIKTLTATTDNLNLAKGAGLEEVISKENKSSVPSKVASTSSTKNLAPQTSNSVSTVEKATVTSPSAARQVPSAASVPVPNKSPSSTVSNTSSVSVDNSNTAAKANSSTSSDDLMSVNKNSPEGVVTSAPLTVNAISEIKKPEESRKATFKFIKNSDKKVKAILVNERQYNKLKASFISQARSLDFGASSVKSVTVSREKIEELMKKASALYREGKVKEAQALYAEISSMNKELNRQQGKPNVLIKKVA